MSDKFPLLLHHEDLWRVDNMRPTGVPGTLGPLERLEYEVTTLAPQEHAVLWRLEHGDLWRA